METKKTFSQQVRELKGIESKKEFLRLFTNKNKAVAQERGCSINELLSAIYKIEGAKELKTFAQWKAEGRKVKKGEKALILWGVYQKKKKEQNHKKEQEQENKKNKKFFTIAHVFDISQVEEM